MDVTRASPSVRNWLPRPGRDGIGGSRITIGMLLLFFSFFSYLTPKQAPGQVIVSHDVQRMFLTTDLWAWRRKGGNSVHL